MQFHPTVLYIAGSSRNLITEAMRGEGAQLVDRNGYRFMPDYDSRAELAPRDIVSRAIVAQMEKTRHPNVYLDLTHLDPQLVRRRFPGIAAICAEFGIEITRDWIPVRPGAHYMIGGVTVDLEGRTSLPGFVGRRRGDLQRTARRQSPGLEQLAGGAGLRGPCRPGGFAAGRRDGRRFSRRAAGQSPLVDAGEPLDLSDIRNSLKSLMWRAAGVRREGTELAEAAENIDRWCRYVLGAAVSRPGGLGIAKYADRWPG